MTGRLFVTIPASDLKPTSALHERENGPVTEIYLGPGAFAFAELRSLPDFDELIRVVVTAKAAHGEAEVRHAARPLVPQDPLTAAVEANARILRERGFYEGGFEPGLIEMAEPLPGVPQRALHPREPLPDLPQREPGVALADIEFTPVGYQGAAQHTYTPACDGFHEPGPCPGRPEVTWEGITPSGEVIKVIDDGAVPSDLPRPGQATASEAGPGQPDPLAEYQAAAKASPEPRTCESGCGCRYGTDDADARECACDGICCGPREGQEHGAWLDEWYGRQFICGPCNFSNCTDCHPQPGTGRDCECGHIDGKVTSADPDDDGT